jgi:hypothetical protein
MSMNRRIKPSVNILPARIALIAALLAPFAVPRAQVPVTAPAICTDSIPGAGSYAQCALSFDGGVLRRGIHRERLGSSGAFRPMALHRMVTGDSAMKYANGYEQLSRMATRRIVPGIVIAVAAETIWHPFSCQNTDTCNRGPTSRDYVGLGVQAVGVGLIVLGANLEERARRAAANAVWWSNSRFAR